MISLVTLKIGYCSLEVTQVKGLGRAYETERSIKEGLGVEASLFVEIELKKSINKSILYQIICVFACA